MWPHRAHPTPTEPTATPQEPTPPAASDVAPPPTPEAPTTSAPAPEADEATHEPVAAAEAVKAAEAEPDVSHFWRNVARPDGSLYLIYVGPPEAIADLDDDHKPRTTLENDNDRVLGATFTP